MLKFYRMYSDVVMPEFATQGSACFDIRAHFPMSHYKNVAPQERILIPTGLKLDIPEGYHVKIYARSGLSYKTGLVMTNSVGIIDSDYVEELFISLTNISPSAKDVYGGDRVAQGMLCKNEVYELAEITEAPKQKTSRVGGFGSTGVQ